MPPFTPSRPLTPRQKDVIAALADGQTGAQMANTLGMSEGSVKTHLAEIGFRLGLRGRVQIALWAARNEHAWKTTEPLQDSLPIIDASQHV